MWIASEVMRDGLANVGGELVLERAKLTHAEIPGFKLRGIIEGRPVAVSGAVVFPAKKGAATNADVLVVVRWTQIARPRSAFRHCGGFQLKISGGGHIKRTVSKSRVSQTKTVPCIAFA